MLLFCFYTVFSKGTLKWQTMHTYTHRLSFPASLGLIRDLLLFVFPSLLSYIVLSYSLKSSLLTQSALEKEFSKVSLNVMQVRERGRMRMMLHFNKTTEKMGYGRKKKACEIGQCPQNKKSFREKSKM